MTLYEVSQHTLIYIGTLTFRTWVFSRVYERHDFSENRGTMGNITDVQVLINVIDQETRQSEHYFVTRWPRAQMCTRTRHDLYKAIIFKIVRILGYILYNEKNIIKMPKYKTLPIMLGTA